MKGLSDLVSQQKEASNPPHTPPPTAPCTLTLKVLHTPHLSHTPTTHPTHLPPYLSPIPHVSIYPTHPAHSYNLHMSYAPHTPHLLHTPHRSTLFAFTHNQRAGGDPKRQALESEPDLIQLSLSRIIWGVWEGTLGSGGLPQCSFQIQCWGQGLLTLRRHCPI